MHQEIKFATSNLQKDLNKRVGLYFEENKLSRKGNWTSWVKILFWNICMYGPLVFLITGVLPLNFGVWIIVIIFTAMGIWGKGLNEMHDAVHGSLSDNKIVNKVMSAYSCLTLAISQKAWEVKHNRLHHTWTNIQDKDEDPEGRKIFRMSPYGEWKEHHKFQHWYALLLYPLAYISWVIASDFERLKRYKTKEINGRPLITRKQYLKAVAFASAGKLLFILIFLVTPIYFVDVHFMWIVGGLVLAQLLAGLLTTLVFQPAHVIEKTKFVSTSRNEDKVTVSDPVTHALETTVNFGMRIKWVTWAFGGLNYQIEHHLFPRINHVHYPALSRKIVRPFCLEFGIPYYSYETWWAAVVAHFQFLKKLGVGKYKLSS